MNKQELKEQVSSLPSELIFKKVMVNKDSVLGLIDRLDEPQKVTVPKVAIDYYEKYKNQISGFDEWFGDFYDSGFLEEFPEGEKLAEWLYDNTNEINNQRELALANLIVNGPSAVEVEPEKLYTVEIPDPHNGVWRYTTLVRLEHKKIRIVMVDDPLWKHSIAHQLTEDEIRKDFDWAWNAGFAKEVQ
ncbi:DUF1642 domain-containing protein [Streptococcus sp. E29BA]|uniref:DUF1642 domain-containing protein n=1 Tax=Streptococcus sp. E29BA TaxID=3278716 RepID=UPI00359DB4C0